ncbi:hypothetical protein [Methanoculleus sp.]|uniref:hypothetical protein n=1 Tax=Methanoculleus sp. TaxID=90427 RepID=UPI001BD6D9CB|nr:hypothetical protein [Methanoculleus sp.]
MREEAAIVVRGEGSDPHTPDRIGYDVRGSPSPVYRALLDRIKSDPWSFLVEPDEG